MHTNTEPHGLYHTTSGVQLSSEPIAIVSSACRLPGHANSPHQLWHLLSTGGIAASDAVPASRFHARAHIEGSGKPGSMIGGAMFIEDVDPAAFDAAFFNISQADAVAMDPQQRQLLEVVYECLENGGLTLERLGGENVGTFVGSFMNDYQDVQARDPGDRPPGTFVGLGRAILSNRISHFYNVRGPSMSIDTACSGGLTSVDIASQYLRSGRISGAIVAAANLQLSPEVMMDTGSMRAAWSPSGRCHSFDAKADGYCRAEAVNAVFLKLLSDALRDGDPIRAIIRGIATNSDGHTPGITRPSGEAQAAAIRAAYADSGLDGVYYGTGFLECHGTGTMIGDTIEVEAAASVLAKERSPLEPLIIGSLKSNIGHSEPAAGISGLIKAVMAVETGMIPGNPTFATPNPNIDFFGLHVRATRESVPWPESLSHYRRASINSFGYGGSNAHVVLENVTHFLQHRNAAFLTAQPFAISLIDCRVTGSNNKSNGIGPALGLGIRPQVLVFSANDEDSLKSQVNLLSQHAASPHVDIKLSDLSYTLSARRSRHFCRAFLSCHPSPSGHVDHIPTNLVQYAKKPQSPPKITFVFTGQGAQWPQMGAGLLRMFPKTSRRCLLELDGVLQALPDQLRPRWSLLEELIEPREADILGQPEFSQPLSTALQLAMMAVLDSWDVQADFAVGHSSGEVAAACCAGLLTPAQAILVAYLRGLAAREFHPIRKMGMLAVGLSPEGVQPYLELGAYAGEVSIACYNSPSSLTLSGPADLLSDLCETVKSDGHFARKLQVKLAYHSQHMDAIAERCESLLLDCGRLASDIEPEMRRGRPIMVSSVTQKPIPGTAACDAAYWKANIRSPVRFVGACKRILTECQREPSILIEIGPSNTLSGPISQIVREAKVENSTYTSVAKRGEDGADVLLDVAGQLFLRDARVSLQKVNTDETKAGGASPVVIVDLPNYPWNHSARYWYESLASSDWRFKNFPQHDLLGDKVLGTLWQSPSWRKTLRLADLPWLRDHRVGSDILFPAAGYIAMAMEAVRQTMWSIASPENVSDLERRNYHYTMKDMRFVRGLILEEGVDVSLMLTLAPITKMGAGWWEYKIMSRMASESSSRSSSTAPGQWQENSQGLIQLVPDKYAPLPSMPRDVGSLPLKYPSAGTLWYKAMADVGQIWGPDFQRVLSIECTEGQPFSRSIVSLVPPSSKWEPQSEYPLHPACMDGLIQAVFPSHHHGSHNNVDGVLLPASIDRLTVSGRTWNSNEALSISTSEFQSVGIPCESQKSLSNTSVFDPLSGEFIMKLKGLVFTPLDIGKSIHQSHTYCRLSWKPDWSFLDSSERLQQALGSDKVDFESEVQELLDLVAHKKPNLKILEVNLVPGDVESLWLLRPASDHSVRRAFSEFHLACDHADDAETTKDLYSQTPNVKFHIFNLRSDTFSQPEELANLDLVLIKASHLSNPVLERIASNVRRLLADNGSLMVQKVDRLGLQNGHADGGNEMVGEGESKADTELGRNENPDTVINGYHTLNGIGFDSKSKHHGITATNIWERHQFAKVRHTAKGCIVAEATVANTAQAEVTAASIVLLHLSPPDEIVLEARTCLRTRGWDISELHLQDDPSLSELTPKSTILVLGEICQPLLAKATESQWTAIQTIIQRECNLLWVTRGSQMTVDSPLNAICHGMFRTIRAEEPLLRLVTLDVESNTLEALPQTISAIDRVLSDVHSQSFASSESEYVERRGLLHVSRIWPDEAVNRASREDNSLGRAPVPTKLHACEATFRLVSEKLGTLDSLAFIEVGDGKPPVLGPNEVEVEIFASGCNFKDVAVAMGIVPEDQTRLGLDGAGLVVRLGDAVKDRHVGQRVAVLRNGCYANRTIASSEATFPIPDFMMFEEAATLPVVFGTSIYGLYHLANLQRRQRVLIHSAAGGIGLACIQLCQRLDCEIFVTVGNTEKRVFLEHEFGIPDNHIFSSRSTSFGRSIQDATQGYGVDVVMNSLTGEMLHESWRLLAPGGTMVEIGKRDILDRNWLPMDPFSHNRSFRSLDLSTLPLNVIGRVLSELSVLIRGGHVRPITPRRIFSYREIPTALQVLRSGNQMGKLVISNGSDVETMVSVRPPRRHPSSLLQPDRAIFIIGGLRGVCGSLAVHLARLGARHLAIMSRSGYQDDVSNSVVRNIRALGCSIDLLQGDVTIVQDVQRCFSETRFPIAGIIQGAVVLRDRIFASMSHADFTESLACKVQGTWNLHTVSLQSRQPITSFVMLSSVSGLIGQKGQANYAGGNVFQDAFAVYRRGLGLPAISVNLGPVEYVGVMNTNESLQGRFDDRFWMSINGILLRRILDYALLQQHSDPDQRLSSEGEVSQLITGTKVPQPADSPLLTDVRFSGLHTSSQASSSQHGAAAQKDKEVQTFLHAAHSPNPDSTIILSAGITAVSAQLTKLLGLNKNNPIDPARPFAAYGMDSLAAVELRNWVRGTVGVELTTLEVMSAASLVVLCKKMIGKMGVLANGKSEEIGSYSVVKGS